MAPSARKKLADHPAGYVSPGALTSPFGLTVAKTADDAELYWRRQPGRAVIDRWERHMASGNLAKRTQKRYVANVIEFEAWLTRFNDAATAPTDRHISDAKQADIMDYLQYLENDRVVVDVRDQCTYWSPLSPSSRKNALAALRSFFRWMILVDPFREYDPTFAVERPRVVLQKPDTLSEQEMHDLLYYEKGHPRSRIQCWLLLFTAARVEEIANLRWSDVDFARNVIHLHGKGDKERIVDLVDDLRPELEYWRELQNGTARDGKYTTPAIRAALRRKETAYVLLSKNGKKLATTTLWRSLKRRAYQAGVRCIEEPGTNKHGRKKDMQSEVSCHTLRRSTATLLLDRDVPLDVVADILGHADVSTTRKHYLNPKDERRTRAMSKLSL